MARRQAYWDRSKRASKFEGPSSGEIDWKVPNRCCSEAAHLSLSETDASERRPVSTNLVPPVRRFDP